MKLYNSWQTEYSTNTINTDVTIKIRIKKNCHIQIKYYVHLYSCRVLGFLNHPNSLYLTRNKYINYKPRIEFYRFRPEDPTAKPKPTEPWIP